MNLVFNHVFKQLLEEKKSSIIKLIFEAHSVLYRVGYVIIFVVFFLNTFHLLDVTIDTQLVVKGATQLSR